jgi:hypothetical protein
MESFETETTAPPTERPGMPLGTKIGVGIGVAGALAGVVAAVLSVAGPSATGGPSDACTRAAACCRRMAGVSPAASTCDDYMKQSGPAAEQVCEDTVKTYRHAGFCK